MPDRPPEPERIVWPQTKLMAQNAHSKLNGPPEGGWSTLLLMSDVLLVLNPEVLTTRRMPSMGASQER